ncbi:prodigiosin biosynthesis protein PigM [Serratia ureilytica]|uniref:prodigiosin biosynthesis protein PigM n=1 Tax=Serratia ureilytica TaxID=300181 RepID=UPI001D182BC1|nr:prodigiosin biosynthesis protein PigM [Serratia ureilytica]MCC4105831.1 prodigiosin biosynthesis protein PigM [Serratia ureilytica]
MTHDLFAAALQQAVDIARQAPSSHNCQPWSLRYDAAARCGRLAIDRRRALRSLPSLEREMLMSCGIFFEYLSALLNCAGMPLAWRWDNAPTHLLSFSPVTPTAPDRDAYRQLAQLIAERHTARAAYQPTHIDKAQQLQLQALFDGTATLLSITGNEQAYRQVAQLTARHAALDFSDRQAWRETYQYIRFNERQPADDGFHLHHLFGPVSVPFKRFFQLAFHPRLSRLTTGLRLPAYMAQGLAQRVAEGPQYLALCLNDESAENLFATGMRLGRLWLMLQHWGWGLHPLSVLVQHAEARRELAETLALSAPPVFFARFGHLQQSGSATPRRSWQSIITAPPPGEPAHPGNDFP